MGSFMLDITLYDLLDPTMSPTDTVRREKGNISYRPRDLTGVIHKNWNLIIHEMDQNIEKPLGNRRMNFL